MPNIKPNGYIRFKTSLGIETDIECHVKVSGVMCVWYSDDSGKKMIFVPDRETMKCYSWFKDLVKEHGECQGIFQNVNKIIIPGEEEIERKPEW